MTGEPRELAHLIRAENPPLVLLDLVLPGKDGIELMQEVPELSDLPVIFIACRRTLQPSRSASMRASTPTPCLARR